MATLATHPSAGANPAREAPSGNIAWSRRKSARPGPRRPGQSGAFRGSRVSQFPVGRDKLPALSPARPSGDGVRQQRQRLPGLRGARRAAPRSGVGTHPAAPMPPRACDGPPSGGESQTIACTASRNGRLLRSRIKKPSFPARSARMASSGSNLLLLIALDEFVQQLRQDLPAV